MIVEEALAMVDNLRRSVLTVQGPQGGQVVLTGADHDQLRDAMNTIRAALASAADQKKGTNDPPKP